MPISVNVPEPNARLAIAVENALVAIERFDAECERRIASFDGGRETDATRSLEKEREKRKRQEDEGELEEALEDTFPASDPAAPTSSTTSGGPDKRKN